LVIILSKNELHRVFFFILNCRIDFEYRHLIANYKQNIYNLMMFSLIFL